MAHFNNGTNIEPAQYRWKRRAVQVFSLLLIIMIPAAGLMANVDLLTASFTVLGQRVGLTNFFLVFGLGIVLISAPIITYMTIGTAFCGWSCPQTMLSEWADNLTHRLLGKRANVGVDSGGLKVASAKNRALNWTILGLSFFVAAALLAIIPFLFVFSPAEIWSFAMFESSPKTSTFVIYLCTVAFLFIDIAVMRYYWCDYVCLYRVGANIFKTHDAMHIAYEDARSADCAKCNYCATSCITDIQPISIKLTDNCINCGECVDACNQLHQKSGTHGLLRFEIGEQGGKTNWLNWRSRISELVLGAFFLLGCTMIFLGVFAKKPDNSQQAIQLAEQKIAKICNAECAPQEATCKAGSVTGCYRAAACHCECFLNHDPSSPSSGQWQQCVKLNTASAEALISNKSQVGVAKPPLSDTKH